MYTNFVENEELDLIRLDAEYYQPDMVAVTRKLRDNPYSYDVLGNLVSKMKDGPGGWAVSTDDYTDTGVPVLRGVNISDATIDLDDCVFISQEKHKELDKHKVLRGDIVISVRGTVGRAAVFDDQQYDEASINAAIVRMRPTGKIDPYFLVAFLNCYYGRKQTERISNGAVQINMNLTETASNLVPTPPQEIQEAIGRRVKMLNFLRRKVDALYDSILRDAESVVEGSLDADQLLEETKQVEEWLAANPLPEPNERQDK